MRQVLAAWQQHVELRSARLVLEQACAETRRDEALETLRRDANANQSLEDAWMWKTQGPPPLRALLPLRLESSRHGPLRAPRQR